MRTTLFKALQRADIVQCTNSERVTVEWLGSPVHSVYMDVVDSVRVFRDQEIDIDATGWAFIAHTGEYDMEGLHFLTTHPLTEGDIA